VTDPLRGLDEAIERLAWAVSSRCSRSWSPEEARLVTLKLLEQNTVPVVPVVPVQKQETHGGNRRIHEFLHLENSPTARESLTSTILKVLVKVGTTGTPLIDQGVIVTKPVAGFGHNGNNREDGGGAEPSGFDAGMDVQRVEGTGSGEGDLAGTTRASGDHAGHDESPVGLLDGRPDDRAAVSASSSLPDDGPPGLPPARSRVALPELPGVPHEWLVGLASMARMAAPASVLPTDWEGFVSGGARLLEEWGAQLAALGWTTADLFALHRERPMDRYDHAGLVRFLGKKGVRAVTTMSATLATRSGSTQTFHRRTPLNTDWVLMWELGDGDR
jgi:hypothetical protein